MTTTNYEALTKAHQHLATDLEKLAQLIEPVNDRALAMVSQVHHRLLDIQELVKHTSKTKPAADSTTIDNNTPKGLVGLFPDDTLAHVSDVLVVLSHVGYDDCGGGEEFTCGMLRLLGCAMEALDYETGRVETLRKAAKEARGEGAAH